MNSLGVKTGWGFKVSFALMGKMFHFSEFWVFPLSELFNLELLKSACYSTPEPFLSFYTHAFLTSEQDSPKRRVKLTSVR